MFPIQFDLPGVFLGGDFPHVNGSLWTLPIETFLYLCLPLLGFVGILSRRWAGVALVVYLIVFSYCLHSLGYSDANRGPFVFAGVPTWTLLFNGMFFFIGSVFYIYRGSIPISRGLALVSVIFLVGAKGTLLWPYALFPAISYLTIYVAIGLPKTISTHAVGDLSYGIYIMAWPIQKTVVALIHGIGPWALAVVALPITAAFAFASWHLVEKPCLRLKRRLIPRQPSLEVVVGTDKIATESQPPSATAGRVRI